MDEAHTIQEIRTPYKGKWLHFKEMDIKSKSGKVFTWEYVLRPGQIDQQVKATGASIIPITKQKPHKLIVEAIYRYPVGNYVLELPSGLVDATDTSIEEACTRELKEQTGYVGKPSKQIEVASATVLTDPWKSIEGDQLRVYEVDMELEANKMPQAELEAEEDIKVFLLSLDKLHDELIKLRDEKKFQIGEKIWALAIGIKLGMGL